MKGSYYLILNNLSEEETKIVTSIISHIERGHRKVGIRQIASENFVSSTNIVRLCKKLGFDGYAELYFYLSKAHEGGNITGDLLALENLVQSDWRQGYEKFAAYLDQFRNTHVFAVGEGFATQVADYIVQRMAICGFMIFNKVHFYDFMMFRDGLRNTFISNVKPSFVIAVSQSGKTRSVVDNVTRAKEHGFRLIAFTRDADSTLARLSDITFIVEPSHENLIGQMPNLFFGKVMLAFELMISMYMKGTPPKPR